MTPRLSYVLPVHNQEGVLQHSVSQLTQRLRSFPGSEVLLIENGSTDGSAALCASLAGSQHDAVRVRAAQSARGMGHALRRGMQLSCSDVVVLSAADLPFAFTDLDAYLSLQPLPRLAIGSKAHPDSRVTIGVQRRLMSEGFRLLRRWVLGMDVGDSQGTLLLDGSLAHALLANLRCGDFLISTEIVCWATRLGVTPVEVPVTYAAAGGSTVSPIRDSLQMARGLFALRQRLAAA